MTLFSLNISQQLFHHFHKHDRWVKSAQCHRGDVPSLSAAAAPCRITQHIHKLCREFFTSGHPTCCEDESSLSVFPDLTVHISRDGRCVKVLHPSLTCLARSPSGPWNHFCPLHIKSWKELKMRRNYRWLNDFRANRVQKGQGIKLFLLDEAVRLRQKAAAEEMNSEVGFILKMT